ncbi:Sugar carrier protein C [Spatholobus suberectus]|nr:Sugar carrier protein C [Spatholobus suberectus]
MEVSTVYSGKLNLRVVLTCVMAASGGLIFGYDHGVSGGIFFVGGALLNGLATSLWMLIIRRMLLGFGIGCANQSVPIYISKMAPYKYRGALNICFQLSITIGIFIANLFNYYFANILDGQGWHLSLGLGAAPTVIFVIGSICLPDSLASLVERSCLEEARKELQKIRSTTEVDAEFNDIVAASEASRKVKHPWKTLRERKYRPPLIFAICIPFFQQFTSLNVITFYTPILFRSIGFGSTTSLMSAIIIGSFKPVLTLISILLVDKFGRRSLFLEGGAQMLNCQIIMTIAIAVAFGTSGNPGTLPKWLLVSCVYMFLVMLGFGVHWDGWYLVKFSLLRFDL